MAEDDKMNGIGTFFGTDYELKLVLLAMLLGATLGSFFDIFRALRRTLKHHPAVVFLEDALFAIIFGIGYYSFCLSLCGGALRGFVLVAMLIGFFVYIYTLGKIICDFSSLTLQAVVKIVKKCIRLLCVVQHFTKRKENLS